jgi:general secretion pathway protein G
MVRNIVTGNAIRHGERETRRRGDFAPSPRLCVSVSGSTGFTLLELMIVITVIIILAAIVLPQYQKTILATREAVLREDLFKMRTLLDQYAADKQKLPQSLDDLVSGGYMRELPKDPVTGQADWTTVTGEDPNSPDGEQGVIDLHSASADTSSEGTPYSEW